MNTKQKEGNLKDLRNDVQEEKSYLKNKEFRNFYNFKNSEEINNNLERLYFSTMEIDEDLPDWPNDEEINNFEFIKKNREDIEKYLVFTDDNNLIHLPKSIMDEMGNGVIWKRPETYVMDNYLDNDLIARFPHKNNVQLRNAIKEFYEKDQQIQKEKILKKLNNSQIYNEEDSIDDYLQDNSQKRLYMKFFKHFEAKYDYKICPVSEIVDRNNKYYQSIDFSANILNYNNFNLNKNEIENIKIKKLCPSSLVTNHKCSDFIKWLTSIFQTINDLEIFDYFNQRETIINKIYPQENNFPIYNPSGRYWIKLYNFGKIKKVEIDDKMPFNKYDEIQTAKCESLEELWPAILTKALLKLFNYKFHESNYLYEEIGDLQIIYALTGYQGERIFLRNPNPSLFFVMNQNNCSNRKILDLKNNFHKEKLNIECEMSQKKEYNDDYFGNFKNKYFDASDHYNNKSTNDKLMIIIQNVLNHENYFKKKKFLLNFNTLNLYTTKKVEYISEKKKFEKIDTNLKLTPQTKKNKSNTRRSNTNMYNMQQFSSSMKKSNVIINSNLELEKYEKMRKLRELKLKTDSTKDNINNLHMSSNAILDKTGKSDKFDYILKSDRSEEKDKVEDTKETLKGSKPKLKLKDMGFFQKLKKARKKRLEDLQEENEKDMKKEIQIRIETFNNNSNTKMKTEIKIKNINKTAKKPEEESKWDKEGQNENIENSLKKSKKKKDHEEEIGPAEALNENNFYSKLRGMINQVATVENEKYENKIYYGFIYPLIDFFDNKNFNMNRLKPLDPLCEVKKYNLVFKNFKQMGKEEKKNILTEITDMKQKSHEERVQKINELKNVGINYKYVKISKSNTFEKYLVHSDYLNEWDINLTKECLENNWDFPPLDFYERISVSKIEEESKDDKVKFQYLSTDFYNLLKNDENKISTEKIHQNEITPERHDNYQSEDNLKKNLSFPDSPNKEKNTIRSIYSNLINNNYEKYFIKKSPIIRNEIGHWIDIKNYFSLFDNFVILHNPKFFKFHLNIDNLWKNHKEDIYNHDESKTVFYINTYLRFNQEHDHNLGRESSDKIINPNKNLISEKLSGIEDFKIESNNIFDNNNFFSIMICFFTNFNKRNVNQISQFSENKEENKENNSIENYLIFDLFVKTYQDNFSIFEENIYLNSFYDVKHLNYIEKNKEYLLVLKGGIFPAGYNLDIYSDCYMEAFSYEKYLEIYKNFYPHKYEIKFDVIEGKKNFLMAKFSIKTIEKINIRINLQHHFHDNLLKNYIQIYVVNKLIPHKKEVFLQKIFFLEESLENYFICFFVNSPYNVKDYIADLCILVRGECEIEKLDICENFEMTDIYIPNKHGILLKDIIHCNDDLNLSIFFRICYLKKSNSYITSNSKINFYKPKTHENITTELLGKSCDKTGEECEFKERLRIKLQIYRFENLVYCADFYNEIMIPNLELRKTHNLYSSNINLNSDKCFDFDTYHISVFFEMSEIPEWLKNYKSFDNEFICWVQRIQSTHGMKFYIDTTKEDKENYVKESWENEEPGRKDRANIARKKYLIGKKRVNGEILSKEEEELLFKKNPTFKIPKNNLEIVTDFNQTSDKNFTVNNIDLNKTKKSHISNINKVDNTQIPKKFQSQKSQPELLETNNEILTTEINKKFPLKQVDEYMNHRIKSFLMLTNREKIHIRHSYNTETKSIILTEKVHEEKINYMEKQVKTYEAVQEKNNIRNETIKNNMITTLKTFYNKSKKNLEAKKSLIKELASTRENFKSKFNFHKQAELNLLNFLKLQNELNDLNQCLEYYENIKNSDFKSETIGKIHKIISAKKEEIILNDIQRVGNKDKNLMLKHLEDFKKNNWNISLNTIEKLRYLSI